MEREREERDRVGVAKRNRERKIERSTIIPTTTSSYTTVVVENREGDGNGLERTLKKW